MKTAWILAVLFSAMALAEADELPDGQLGYPLGSYLIVEGERPMDIPFNAASFSPGVPAGQMHPHELRVDTVNGKKLKRPITVVLTNAELLGDQTRCVLRGYEVGATVGIPAEVTRKEKAFTEHYGTGQGELHSAESLLSRPSWSRRGSS